MFFPRMWRGFGTDANDAPSNPLERNYFRPRISSISGMLHNVAKGGGRFLHSPPSRAQDDCTDAEGHYGYPHGNAIYPYSSRQSIDSVNFSHYLPMDIDGQFAHFACSSLHAHACNEHVFCIIFAPGDLGINAWSVFNSSNICVFCSLEHTW